MKLSFIGEQCVRISEQGEYDLPADAVSELPLRFVLIDGEVQQRYQGLSDEEAMAEHDRLQAEHSAAVEQERARNFYVTPNGFQRWLGADRRIAIRGLAASDPVAADLVSTMGFLTEIWSQHSDFVKALQYLQDKDAVLAGLLDDFYATGRKYEVPRGV